MKKECWPYKGGAVENTKGKESESSNSQYCAASTLDEGEIMCSEVTIIVEVRKRSIEV